MNGDLSKNAVLALADTFSVESFDAETLRNAFMTGTNIDGFRVAGGKSINAREVSYVIIEHLETGLYFTKHKDGRTVLGASHD